MTATHDLLKILDTLCPMYVLLGDSGHIRQVGPTLQKLRPDQPMQGQRFLELFELNRPRCVEGMSCLLKRAGAKLHLSFRDDPRTALKGVLVPLPGNQGAIVNLSFGISVLDAVRDYALTSADFSATDLTIELLYLVEAKSAAMEASRMLNLRLQGAMIAAEEQAFTDTLTGLKNRRAMDHILGRLLDRASRFSLMHIDLDFFKSVNDTYGHAAGDFVLQHVAHVMVEETRSSDTVARVGGDEFVLIFDGLQDADILDRIARRIIARLEEPIRYNGEICRISASVGTTLFEPGSGADAARLLHEADVALYAAKNAGRAQHFFFDASLDAEDMDQKEAG
ncbi:MAG: diguanylate cyclase [Rhodobacteraceae bacterium]|nr:diguanylate cyclase [Paracoccaceae bacterium]